MNTFDSFQLQKSLQKAIDDLGFTTPTPIQEKSFKPILSGRDIMGIAQTGTGKTWAYLLPLLKLYRFTPTETPKIVILVPTRELVIQIVDEVKKLTKYMSVRTLGIYGGVNINTQKKLIYEGIDILVGTPGRVMDLALDNVLRFDEAQKLVIDEFDEILNLGFRSQISSILTMMKPKRQNILFSATMTDDVDQMLTDYFNFPEEISLAPSGTPLETIKQRLYNVANFNTKVNLLIHLLTIDTTMSKILIFVNNKKIADLLYNALENDLPHQLGLIHSNKSQNYRLNAMTSFKEGELRGLITTDVMARGLDIPNISHVINFEIPESPESYIHRIGRTGRAETTGEAISFVTTREENNIIEAELLMNKEIESIILPEEIEIATTLLDFEKEKLKISNHSKKIKIDTNSAFHEKKDKNKKVNMGGPGKRNPRKTKPRNRAVERKRNQKNN